MAVGSDTSQIMALGINRRPCTHESLDAVPSLHLPTNKSYFPVQKKVAGAERGKYQLNDKNNCIENFPGGPVVKNPPASAGDMGSVPRPGRFHMLQSN